MYNIESTLYDKVKFNPKRNSDDIIEKSNLLLLHKKTDSYADTSGESDKKKISKKKIHKIPKKKRICIKFKDLVVESEKDDDDDNHLELALLIKKRQKNEKKEKIKITKCDEIVIFNKKEKNEINNKQKNNISKSVHKVILGEQNEENKILKKIRRKLICC